MFKPKYYFWDSSPKRFYYFVIYFSIPVGMLRFILTSVDFFSNSPSLLDILVSCFQFLLIGVAEINLVQKKWIGPILFLVNYYFIFVYNFIFSIVYYFYGLDSYQLIINSTASLFIAFLSTIYFSKRRPLFSPWLGENPDQPSIYPADNCAVSSSDNKLESDPAERIDSVPSSASAITPAATDTIQDTQRISRSSSTRQTIAIICLALVSAVLLITLGITLNELSTAKSNIAELETSLDSLENRIKLVTKSRDEYQSKYNQLYAENLRLKMSYEEQEENYYRFYYDLSWYYNHIGFIVEGSSYYHSYDCSIFEEADTYWAHNLEYCKYLGYSRCPYCFSDDMLAD